MVLAFQFQITLIFFHFADCFLSLCIFSLSLSISLSLPSSISLSVCLSVCACGFVCLVLLLAYRSFFHWFNVQCDHQRFLPNSLSFFSVFPSLVIEKTNYLLDSCIAMESVRMVSTLVIHFSA